MLVGYMRVSTAEQTLALQHDALRAAGCERVYDDTAAAASRTGPGLLAPWTRCATATRSSSGNSTGSAAPSRT